MKLTHDTDDDCAACPFGTEHVGGHMTCAAVQRCLPDEGDTAPTWCPLRSGPVTVEKPEPPGVNFCSRCMEPR